MLLSTIADGNPIFSFAVLILAFIVLVIFYLTFKYSNVFTKNILNSKVDKDEEFYRNDRRVEMKNFLKRFQR